MVDMRASPPLAPLTIAAGWRNRDIPKKKWQCPCGKVLPIVQKPREQGIQHPGIPTGYGTAKVVPEFCQGSISADPPLLRPSACWASCSMASAGGVGSSQCWGTYAMPRVCNPGMTGTGMLRR